MSRTGKGIAAILILTFVVAISVALVVGHTEKERPAHSNLYSDSGYVNYARDVRLDYVAHPELAENGLFWTKWDAAAQKVVEVPSDSAEGAALIDPAKPTIIMVHGFMSDGFRNKESYATFVNVPSSEFGMTTEKTWLPLLWQNAGWNVGVYHHEKFTSSDPFSAESKIWSSTETESGMTYKKADGKRVTNVTPYSTAEHFAADYIRAMQRLPDTMGAEEIRIAAHSMGGELTMATLFLLGELSDYGQLPASQLPHRLALLDPYFSNPAFTPHELTIRWSGKQIVDERISFTLAECLKAIAARGTAIEYYTYKDSDLVSFFPKRVMDAICDTAVVIIGDPDFQYRGYSDRHGGIRDWYSCSIYSLPVKDGGAGAAPSAIAASASTPTDIIQEFRGTLFLMTEGQQEVNADTAVFVRTDKEFLYSLSKVLDA